MPSYQKIYISGVGCCLVDQLFNHIPFADSSIEKYLSKSKGDGGLKPGQLVFADEFEVFAGEPFSALLPRITNERNPDSINIGGPAIVALIHAAQMLKPENYEVSFYGMYGDDDIGAYLHGNLERTPVDITHLTKSEGATPSTVVFSDPHYADGQGERMFINAIATAWKMTPEHLNENFFNSHITVFGGTALTPKIHDNLSALLIKAREKNSFTIVNTVFDFRNDKRDPYAPWPMGDSDESYHYIDLLIMDHLEALRYSGKNNLDQAIEFFKTAGCNAFIITNGASGVCIYAKGENFKDQSVEFLPVSNEVSKELKKSNTGDTTGCGDNFAGGVIASVAAQKYLGKKETDIREAAYWGIVSGGFACFYLGGTYFEEFAGEKRDKIEELYEEYSKQCSENK